MTVQMVIGGRVVRRRATLTTDHPASSYGQPVLLIDGEPYGRGDAEAAGLVITKLPRGRRQLELLELWHGAL